MREAIRAVSLAQPWEKKLFPIALVFGLGLLLLWGFYNLSGPVMQSLPTLGGGSGLAVADTSFCAVCPRAGLDGPDYSGRDYSGFNFASLGPDALVGANFEGATLKGCNFRNMNLSNTNFRGANLGLGNDSTKTDFSGAVLTNTCFVNANLYKARFTYNDFYNTNFQCATLDSAYFGTKLSVDDTETRTNFSNTRIDVSLFPLNSLSQKDWAGINLSNVTFVGVSPKQVYLRGKNMKGALLRGANLSGFDLTGCNLTDVDLRGASLRYAVLDSTRLIRTRFDSADLSFAQVRGALCYDSTIYSVEGGTKKRGFKEGAIFSNATLQYVDMEGSQLAYANLQGADLRNGLFRGVTFDHVTFTGAAGSAQVQGLYAPFASFDSVNMDDLSFAGAMLRGISFKNQRFVNTDFTNAMLAQSNFSGTTLQGVTLTSALLYDADFSEATMMPGTDGTRFDVSCAHLGGVNFTNATIAEGSNFSDAVIPEDPERNCCRARGGGYRCGLDTLYGIEYGATILPELEVKIVCPDGSNKKCKKRSWYINNNFTTNACSADGSPETRWEPMVCSYRPQVILFRDEKLKAAIVDQVFAGQDPGNILRGMVETVKHLNLSNQGITNLYGLQYFTNLESLDLSGNEIATGDYTIFPKLRVLKLNNNPKLQRLNIGGLFQLKTLEARNCGLRLVVGVDSVGESLEYIDLSQNKIPGVDFSGLSGLCYLNMGWNAMRGSRGLDQLPELEVLYLHNNNLTEVPSLSSSAKLSHVDFSCNESLSCDALVLPKGSYLRHYCGDNNPELCSRPPYNFDAYFESQPWWEQ